MKEIKNFDAEKYNSHKLGHTNYTKVETGIYECGEGKNKLFVTSLSFVQEPELGEGENADDISQYPLEDVLDKYFCHISDFYEKLNVKKSKTCYLEFASGKLDNVKSLRKIIGKHVYNKEIDNGDQISVKLVIE